MLHANVVDAAEGLPKTPAPGPLCVHATDAPAPTMSRASVLVEPKRCVAGLIDSDMMPGQRGPSATGTSTTDASTATEPVSTGAETPASVGSAQSKLIVAVLVVPGTTWNVVEPRHNVESLSVAVSWMT